MTHHSYQLTIVLEMNRLPPIKPNTQAAKMKAKELIETICCRSISTESQHVTVKPMAPNSQATFNIQTTVPLSNDEVDQLLENDSVTSAKPV